MQKKERLANIELLRILAMIGVVVNHFFNYGMGIYDGYGICPDSGTDYLLYYTLQAAKALALPSVDCYVLITGYFLIGSCSPSVKGLCKVWSETWFYSVAIGAAALATGNAPCTWRELAGLLFPLATNEYWFVTSYIFLLLVAPFLSMLARGLSRRQYRLLLIVGLAVVFRYPFGLHLVSDQQFLLFIYLYLAGGYIRKYVNAATPLRPRLAAVAAFVCLMLLYCTAKNAASGTGALAVYGLSYNGLVLPAAVAVFLLFLSLRIGRRAGWVINAVSPLSLAVYLIHCHPMVEGPLWRAVSETVAGCPPGLLPLLCYACSAAIFLACIFIDCFRHAGARLLLGAAPCRRILSRATDAGRSIAHRL